MSSSGEGYTLENGPFGLRAVINSRWNQQTHKSLTAQPIAELELNDAKGWRGEELAFLEDFPELLAFRIIDLSIKSVAAIHILHNLRALDVLTYCKTELRFGEFPRLVECSFEWRPKSSSVFNAVPLRKLFINRFSGSDTDSFANLRNLESLALLGSPLKSLKGLRSLTRLRSLRLGALRALETLKGIEGLGQLEKLEIDTCRKISSIEEIRQLKNLRILHLDNMGEIPSLESIKSLEHLRRLTFVGSTNIVDGDLTSLMCFPGLELISFQNRKHYSHTRECIKRSYSSRVCE